MVKVWSDLVWNDYLEFFNKHLAKDDLVGIIDYIQDVLQNPIAAENTLNKKLSKTTFKCF